MGRAGGSSLSTGRWAPRSSNAYGEGEISADRRPANPDIADRHCYVTHDDGRSAMADRGVRRRGGRGRVGLRDGGHCAGPVHTIRLIRAATDLETTHGGDGPGPVPDGG